MKKNLSLFLIAFFMLFMSKYSITQNRYDINGIWISSNYSCYELIGTTADFFNLEIEVLSVTQDEHNFVSAMKCIGDNCVPAGFISWNGTLTDSIILGNFLLGSPDNAASGSMPTQLTIINDSTIHSTNSINFKKISCSQYQKIQMSKHNNYFDCKLCVEYFDIPNVFTPNGDGINDVWTFFLPQNVSLLNFDIYDRWGVLTKSVTKKQPKDGKRICMEQWDGYSVSGLSCSSGVYFYTIKYVDDNNKTNVKSGYVHLFR